MKKSQKAIITMLNDDKTVPSKVKIEDVKIFNNLKKSLALQVVINHCKEMDQGLVHSKVFIDARNAIECSICQRDVKTKENLNASGLCTFCQKQIDREKKEKEVEATLYKSWKQLEKDLLDLDPGYVFVLDQNKIKRTVNLEGSKDFVEISIFRGAIYSGSAWNQRITGYALRIQSNKHGIDALGLKKDFSGKNVAKSLHKKIEKMIKDHENRLQLEKRQKAKKLELVKAITKELGADIAIKNVYSYPKGRSRGGVVSSIEKEVQFDNLQLMVSQSTNDPGKIKYRIKGISKSLTLKQIKEISKIIN